MNSGSNNNQTTMMNKEAEEEEEEAKRMVAAARPFLRGELEAVDPDLPRLVSVLRAAGAGECYHKHGTFLAHLVDVYRILRLWGAPAAVARCGLFHSAYSNSYVDLAIFPPDAGRGRVRAVVGQAAERLVHLFCVVPRHELIHDRLHLRYTDGEIRDHLHASHQEIMHSSAASAAAGNSGGDNKKHQQQQLSAWRVKLRGVVPLDGVVAAHIRTGEAVRLPRRVLAVFVLLTVADFSDQYTDYQDKLFRNDDGRLAFRGDHWRALWPGTGKPGLWVSALSRLAAIYNLLARDEQLRAFEAAAGGGRDHSSSTTNNDHKAEEELVVPPIFERCTRVLDPDDQKHARDLYWQAICSDDDDSTTKKHDVEALLVESIRKNPFVGEPHLVLAQVYLNAGRFEDAAAAARRGLRLLLQWGSSWDKRMSWEGWVSWARVMADKARTRKWPRSKWGIINLGLVDGVLNHTTAT